MNFFALYKLDTPVCGTGVSTALQTGGVIIKGQNYCWVTISDQVYTDKPPYGFDIEEKDFGKLAASLVNDVQYWVATANADPQKSPCVIDTGTTTVNLETAIAVAAAAAPYTSVNGNTAIQECTSP